MYFDSIEKLKLDQLVEDKKPLYAHLDGQRKETLEQHMDLAVKYLQRIIETKKLDHILLKFEKVFIDSFAKETKLLYREMIFNTVYMHDLGKVNCNFQYRKMNNDTFRGVAGLKINNSRHSMLSSLIYINHYYNEIQKLPDKEEKNILRIFMLLHAYVISKHHGSLDSFYEFREKMIECDGEGKKLYTESMEIFDEIYTQPIIFTEKEQLLDRTFAVVEKRLSRYEEENKGISISFYIYERFLTSLLLACDYYATFEFKREQEITDLGEINDVENFLQFYKNTEVYKSIRKYEKEAYGQNQNLGDIKEINVLRTELFLDAEKNLFKNMDKNIYYLEAPTGSGKSNTSLNLSFQIIKQCESVNKILYIYPFNTLIEQNIKILHKTFENSEIINDIAVINSVVPIGTKERLKGKISKEEVDRNEDSDVIYYEEALLDRQFLHYPMVLTTHVSMFQYLFGTSKDNLFPLYQIANSVIILDEIQSYKNNIWKEIITFLKYYGELLNIKFIIMSATLPNLNQLIDGEWETVRLIQDREKYFSHPLFKDRVQLDFSLLEQKENLLNVLLEHVFRTSQSCEGNILIEFIKKKTAKEFYDKFIAYQDKQVEGTQLKKKQIELITGDDNSIERNEIIHKIETGKDIILVATQVIEAGVDIDMDIGYKDISMLDSEEQFLGRINRSCKKLDSKVYFFDLDSASNVYRNDVRKEKNISLLSEKMREILINKNFENFYQYVLQVLNKTSNMFTDKNFTDFINTRVNRLNFTDVEERMRLIDERYEYTIFLDRVLKLENGEILRGKDIWEKYVKILKDNHVGYAKRKILLSQVQSKLNYFIYKIDTNNFAFEDRIGDIYYIPNGENYFKNGKFDRGNFNKGIGEFI